MARRSYDRMYKEADLKNYENNVKTENKEVEEISLPEVKEEEKKASEDPKIGKVIGGLSLNVRNQPSTDGEVIAIVKNGEQVVIVDELNDEWYKIDSPEGYVMKKFIELYSA